MIEILSSLTTPVVVFGLMTAFFYLIRYMYDAKNKQHEEMYCAYISDKEGNVQREKEHVEMHVYFQRNKEVDMVDIKVQLAIVLDRINHTNDNSKAAAQMIMDAWNKSDRRMDKLEERLNQMQAAK